MYKKRAHDFICSAPSLNSIPLIQLKSSVYKNKYRRIVVEIRELSNSIREISLEVSKIARFCTEFVKKFVQI